ncbi:MAG: tetratricopeptide repeat protein [Roseivirga sp.]
MAQGLLLFQKEKYESAQHHLEAYIRMHGHALDVIEARYYAALCAIKLDRPDGEARFHQFIQAHPQHPKAVLAYYQLGTLYFTQQDFAKSINYYLQVDPSTLDEATQQELQYRLAYAYLSEKDFEQAGVYFNAIKEREHAYCYAARYYAGYIAFKQEDYTTALEDLMQASESPAYQPIVPYLVLQVYYKQKRFQELLTYIQEVRGTEVALKNEDEIALLTAEACFFTEDYAAAVQHYEEHMALKDFVVPPEVLYRTAYALYRTDEAYKALQHFKALALQEDALGQSASYYAGLLYLKANQKTLALTALDRARQANFSSKIKEEATFQYAKVSYELGHFAHAIAALQQLKKAYTTSPHLPEADVLLSEAYLRTNDYALAIAHLEGLADRSQRMHKVYQKVTFYKGSEYFNQTAYEPAISLFRKSLQHPLEADLVLQAQLWLGESLSAQQQYEPAMAAYQEVLRHAAPTDERYRQALYGLGYAYFNVANYAQALPQFVQYTSLKQGPMPSSWRQDALLRLADCYYATKEYQQALRTYQQASQHHPAHVLYQQGMIYDALGDSPAAQASFQKVLEHHATTGYYEKALFEHAHIDFVQHRYAKAIQGFTRLIEQKPHSGLIPDALLNRAIAYVNQKQYSQAAQDYAQLLEAYPHHLHAQSALLALPEVGAQAGTPEKFQQYLASYQAAHPDADQLVQVAFDTAKAAFYDQRYGPAIAQLEAFITSYPKSEHIAEARFLLAEAYYRQGEVPDAQAQYQAALKDPNTPFYNKMLLRMGALAYSQKDFAQALRYYQQLQDRAKSKKESYYALEGIMKANHALQRYEAVQQYASLIIEQGNLAAHATREATLFLGKAALQQRKFEEAQAHFTQVVQGNTQDNYAAEAQYLLALLHYETGAYQQSLEALFELNKQFSTYEAWTNQGFLLIADNYIALQEDFQAKATLQSIIDHAGDEAMVARAQQKLTTLMQKADHSSLPAEAEQDTFQENNEFKALED